MQQASSAPQSPPDTGKSQNQQASPAGLSARQLRHAFALVLGVVLLASLIVPLANTGLWDPHELQSADLARRIAVNLFDTAELSREGADNSIPTVEEVGRGELPLLSMALGLKVFGSAAWALRSAMLVWGLLGLLSTYLMTARLGGRRLGVLAVLVLVTMPLFFVHARTALGEIATMACVATAFAGWMLALFDVSLGKGGRSLSLLMGGLASAGALYCRGALIGVALPLLAATSCWWVVKSEGRRVDWASSLMAPVLGMLGLGFAVWGGYVAFLADKQDYFIALGTEAVSPKQFPTHDFVVHHLGHALYPWSALAPLSIALALRPAAGQSTAPRALRLGLVLMAVLGVGAYTALSPRTGPIAFAPVFAFAALIAVAVTELDERPAGAVPVALICAGMLVLLGIDFKHFPEKAFSAFAIGSATFPPSFEKPAKYFIYASLGLGGLGAAVLVVHRAMLEGDFPRLARIAERVGNALRLHRRGTYLGGSLGVAALLLSVGYYPALAAQLSPRGAFDAYEDLAEPGEPLALMGSQSGTMFFAGSPAEVFKSTKSAMDWLLEKPDERRWLVTKSDDLAALNSRFRAQSEKLLNLPVLDARSSQALLLSNQLREGEESKNPLDEWLPAARPEPAHGLQVVLDERLSVLGWEIRKANGKTTDKLDLGEPYELAIAYQVLTRVTGKWKTFIHIDGEGKRFNGDHETLDGEYPYRYWAQGDYVVDTFKLKLDQSYKPGTYTVYFGLFSGDKRMPVTTGKHDDDRITGGTVQVVDQ